MPKSKDLKFHDIWSAVFNMHVNNAGERAMAIVRQIKVQPPETLDLLERDYKNGIMAIFNRDADSATRTFGILCFTFANGLDKQ